jgi:hypothetical protein
VVRGTVEETLNALLDAEADRLCNAQRYERSEAGRDTRAGHYERGLQTKAGEVRLKVPKLGKVYAADAPAFGKRSWKLIIPGRPTGGPFGDQKLVYNDDYVSTELGQIGTQFDGPGHIGVITSKGMFYFNGRYLHDKEMSSDVLGPLGVEHVAQKGSVCRGVLLDAVALRGGQLPVPKERLRSRHRHRQGCRGDGQTAGHRADRGGRLRVPPHRLR